MAVGGTAESFVKEARYSVGGRLFLFLAASKLLPYSLYEVGGGIASKARQMY